MAQRDDASIASRRIFLAWMMALPVAGRAAAQGTNVAPSPTQTVWRDEYDPTKTAAQKERCWLGENRDQPLTKEQRERCWLDEIGQPTTAKKERSWLDEFDPTKTAKQKERCWLDEINQPLTAKQKERCWLDEIGQPRR